MPNASTVIHTNLVPKSTKTVLLKVITFDDLWSNYVHGDPYEDPTGAYENQCAIRMSATLHKLGIEMKSFSAKTVKPAQGSKTIGRILMDGKPTATRAEEMGNWLALRPFAGLPAAEDITGLDWESKVKGRTGIIAFSRYWHRASERSSPASGGHIDLWNGFRTTYGGFKQTTAVVGRQMGLNAAGPEDNRWWSDLRNAENISFWEIR